MPSKKQRRRDQKLRRHEYEWVVPGDEGEQVVKPRELRAEKEAARPKPAAASKGQSSRSRARPVRAAKPPSWMRSAKRVGWIGPAFFLLILATGGKHKPSVVAALLQAVVLTALFIPMTYWLDRIAYRSYLKRTGGTPS